MILVTKILLNFHKVILKRLKADALNKTIIDFKISKHHQMKHLLSVSMLLGTAMSQESPHSGKEYIDTSLSDDQTGLILWQYFFQHYVEGQHAEASADNPGSYDANIHVCWF